VDNVRHNTVVSIAFVVLDIIP